MTGRTLRLGTRASLLATTQSRHVAEAVAAASGLAVELVPITSQGDVLTGPLAQMGGTGVFATALRDALMRDECDFLVHSMKDLPTAPSAGIVVGAVPLRASQRDILHSREGLTLDELPAGARVGTGSPRRVAQVRARRPDLVVEGIRGNVDSRLRKVHDGEYDAIVLAEAGLRRIGRDAAITEVLPWPTSAAQGALAVEVRDGDEPVAEAVALIEDADSALAAHLERAVLRRLEAGCAAPVAIDAERHDDVVTLVASVYAEDGSRSVTAERRLDPHVDVDAAAADVVAELFEGGAADLADLAGTSR